MVATAAARCAGGFAFEVSSLVDSAITVSSTNASTTARKLRHASGDRFGGSLRLVVARLRERANARSISDRVCHDTRRPDLPPIRTHKTAAGLGIGAPVRSRGEVRRRQRGRSMTTTRFMLLLAATALLGLFLAAGVRAEPPGGEGEGGEKTPFVRAAAPGPSSNWSFECTATSGGANTNLDCDEPLPNNEPNIVVDPANPLHMIASSNDYGSCCDQFYTTFDGGATWSTGNMSTERPTTSRTGSDPVTAFDVSTSVALALLAELPRQPAAQTCRRRRGGVPVTGRRPDLGQVDPVGPGGGVATSSRPESSTTRSGSRPTTTPVPFYGEPT